MSITVRQQLLKEDCVECFGCGLLLYYNLWDTHKCDFRNYIEVINPLGVSEWKLAFDRDSMDDDIIFLNA